MTIAAQTIIQRVVGILQDGTSIRWPVNELVRYLNDGQREVVLNRPDCRPVNATRALTAGTRQTLPVDGAKLISVIRNSAGTRRAVRMTNREILDAQSPGWHGLSGASEVLHFMYDPRDPTVFYVYPPAASGASLEIVYSSYPTNITEPGEGTTFTAVSGDLSVPDIFANAIQDYILYRVYTKDSEYAGNASRAQAHYAAFAAALGMEIQATLAVQPMSPGNPNTARAAAPG